MTIRDNKDMIFLLYHYYRVGGPPKGYPLIGFRVQGLGSKLLAPPLDNGEPPLKEFRL